MERGRAIGLMLWCANWLVSSGRAGNVRQESASPPPLKWDTAERTDTETTKFRNLSLDTPPHGKIRIEVSQNPRDTETLPPVGSGQEHARTQGIFQLAYTLVRRPTGTVARRVRVRVINHERYFSPATPRLREHEAMHSWINRREALRIQKILERFQTTETNPTLAENMFKAEFKKQIDQVKKLHADWDENHVFIQQDSKGAHPHRGTRSLLDGGNGLRKNGQEPNGQGK